MTPNDSFHPFREEQTMRHEDTPAGEQEKRSDDAQAVRPDPSSGREPSQGRDDARREGHALDRTDWLNGEPVSTSSPPSGQLIVATDTSASDESLSASSAPSSDKALDVEPDAPVSTASREPTVALAFARLAMLEGIVRNQTSAEKRRSEELEQRIGGLEEALLGQTADMEAGYRTADAAVTERLEERFAALSGAIERAEAARAEAEKRALEAETQAVYVRAHHDAYRQAWQAAPLLMRLRFVRELLPAEHSSHSALKEAAALEELRRRGQDLETWLTNYPSLFADAMQSLDAGTEADDTAPDAAETDPVEILAAQTAADARAVLESALQAMGVTWIAPSPGDAVLAEHEVVGEEESPSGEGRIAQMRRRGFRIRGRLAVPAQVTRAIRPGARPAAGAKQGDAAGAAEAQAARIGAAFSAGAAATAVAPQSAVDPSAALEPVADGVDGGATPRSDAGSRKSATAEESATYAARKRAGTASPETGAPARMGGGAGQDGPTVARADRPEVTAQTEMRGAIDPPAENAGDERCDPARENVEPAWWLSQSAAARPASAGGTDPVTQPATDVPDWLRMLGQRTFACDLPTVTEFTERLSGLGALPEQIAGALPNEEARTKLIGAIEPLLPLLGLRYADGLAGIPETWGAVFLEVRDPLLAWLQETMNVQALVPIRGARFDPRTMEAVETRRTVHSTENETVARVERVGVVWQGETLLRAQVVRYASEGTP